MARPGGTLPALWGSGDACGSDTPDTGSRGGTESGGGSSSGSGEYEGRVFTHQWGGQKGTEGTMGQNQGISVRGSDVQQMGWDASSQQAGQHNADELQQCQAQGGRGDIKHVAADKGRHLAEASVPVQPVHLGRAALATPTGPAAAEGHRAVLLQPPGRGEPVPVALHTAAGQSALQSVQGIRRRLVLPVGEQGLAQPLLEALRSVLAVAERREPRRQPGRQHGGQESAVGAEEAPVLRGGAEAAQEAPDDDGGAGSQEDGGRAGVVAGRQRQVAPQRHLGPEADDEHGQPRCPEDQAEGHERQLEHGHAATGPLRRRAGCGGPGPDFGPDPGEVLPRPPVPPGDEEGAAARGGGVGGTWSKEVRADPVGSPGQPSVRDPTAPSLLRLAPRFRPVPFFSARRGGAAAGGALRAAGLGGSGRDGPQRSGQSVSQRDGKGREGGPLPSPLPVPSSFKQTAASR